MHRNLELGTVVQENDSIINSLNIQKSKNTVLISNISIITFFNFCILYSGC